MCVYKHIEHTHTHHSTTITPCPQALPAFQSYTQKSEKLGRPGDEANHTKNFAYSDIIDLAHAQAGLLTGKFVTE